MLHRFFGICGVDAGHLLDAYREFGGSEKLEFKSEEEFVRKIGENIFNNYQRVNIEFEGDPAALAKNCNYFKFLDDEIHLERKREAKRLEVNYDDVDYNKMRIRILRAIAKRSIDFFLLEGFENQDLRTDLQPWIDRD